MALDLGSFTEILVVAHSGLSLILGMPMLVITQAEGEKMAAAIQRVARHYDMPILRQETVDWINAIQTMAYIYGTRIMAARMMRDNQTKTDTPAQSPQSEGGPNEKEPNPQNRGPVLVKQPGLPDVTMPAVPGAREH